MRKILGCFIFLMITSQIFAGTVYYVDATNGNDANPGTGPLPWRTIQKAANTMIAGDTVTVYDGTYAERVTETTSGSEGNLITYQVNSGDTVSCQGFVITGDYIKIDGFTVTATFCALNAAGIWVEGDNCIIENNYAYNNPKSGIMTRASSSNCIIRNNRCYLNSNSGITIQGTNHLVETNEVWGSVVYHAGTGCTGDADGFRFFGSGHIFRGNYIHDISYDDPRNAPYGPHIDAFQTWPAGIGGESAGNNIIFEQNWIDLLTDDGWNTAHGWMLHDAQDITIRNNVVRAFRTVNTGKGSHGNLTFVNNLFINDLSSDPDLSPMGIGLENVSGCVIKNNIFYDIIDDQIAIRGGSGIDIDYNCFYRSDDVTPVSDGAPNAHDLWGINPKFVNVLENDFHLQSDSPCIEAGETLSEVTNDYDGNFRPYGTWYDIGAFEYVGVNPPLSVNINASPTSGEVPPPLTVNFTGGATGGVLPYSYSWDFGDGTSSSEQIQSHTYYQAGVYTVTLTVTDSENNQDSESITINVSASTTSLEASFIASPISGYVPLTVNFTGSATGGTPPCNYSWDFGDGTSSIEQNPSHTYSEAGDYTVYLTVTDSESNQDNDSLTINASAPATPLEASCAASPISGKVPLTVNFTGSATGGTEPYTYSWDFGDSTSSSEQSPSHIYSQAGDYTVSLTVTDSQSNQDNDSLIINVSVASIALEASCAASPTSGEIPLTVNFTGNASGGTPAYSYSWDFGDSTSSSEQIPTHTYSDAGDYTVTLTVTDSQSNQDSDSLIINASALTNPIVASCAASPSSGEVPLTVNFTGSATGGVLPYSYSWDFGDGTSSSEQNPSHVYSQAGDYTVYLTVTDSESNQDSDSVIINVSAYIPTYLSCSPTSFYFGATTSGNETQDQYLRIINAGSGILTWNIEDDADWLSCSPSSGTDRGEITVSVNASGLPLGLYVATITISSPEAYNSPQYVSVNLRVYEPEQESPPFGSLDTPVDGSTVSGSIPVTGWALDDIEVVRLEIKRNSDPVDPLEAIGPDGLVYIGDAVFVEGARPDVEKSYADYPLNSRAGWGYMLLTNDLPYRGNGSFTIYTFAYDASGQREEIGRKTILCDNANRVKPFGTIDTREQGESIGGSDYINFGWALTPLPKTIPKDGSTISVWVDGVQVGHPVYDQYREDIATLYPEYNNAQGAVGYYYLDTTQYENGVHTIAWSVMDDEGEADEIGARYFSINNIETGSTHDGSLGLRSIYREDVEERLRIGIKEVGKEYRPQVDDDREIDTKSILKIQIEEMEPLRIVLEESSSGNMEYIGWGENKSKALPIGSTLDREKGIFSWIPTPGFIGRYVLHFAVTDGSYLSKPLQVEVNVVPKSYD